MKSKVRGQGPAYFFISFLLLSGVTLQCQADETGLPRTKQPSLFLRPQETLEMFAKPPPVLTKEETRKKQIEKIKENLKKFAKRPPPGVTNSVMQTKFQICPHVNEVGFSLRDASSEKCRILISVGFPTDITPSTVARDSKTGEVRSVYEWASAFQKMGVYPIDSPSVQDDYSRFLFPDITFVDGYYESRTISFLGVRLRVIATFDIGLKIPNFSLGVNLNDRVRIEAGIVSGGTKKMVGVAVNSASRKDSSRIYGSFRHGYPIEPERRSIQRSTEGPKSPKRSSGR